MSSLAGHPVVITDGLWRKSLSAIRSLGKAGADVHVVGHSLFTTGFYSRFTNTKLRAPDATADPERFGARLIKHLATLDDPVLFPMEEGTIRWLADHRDALPHGTRFLIPSSEALSIAFDKGKTSAAAAQASIPTPVTQAPEDPAGLASLVATMEPGSFVVKPRSGSGSSGVVYGEQRDRGAWSKYWVEHGPAIVQERVPTEGRAVGVALLYSSSGSRIASFTHQRLKQYPVSGGPSTDRESIHEPQLEAWSATLLESLNWRGIAMVEWKQHPISGAWQLLEINPRFWGSLELAVRAGVDFPRLYALAALGTETAALGDYPDQVRCRWMIPGEVLRYLSSHGQRESVRAFLSGLPGIAEEWDSEDKRGALATLVCTDALALDPRYWRYVKRR